MWLSASSPLHCYCTLHVTLSTWLPFFPLSSCVWGMNTTSFNDSTVILLRCLFKKLLFLCLSDSESPGHNVVVQGEKWEAPTVSLGCYFVSWKEIKSWTSGCGLFVFTFFQPAPSTTKQTFPSLLLDTLSDTESMKMKILCWLQK